MSPLSFDDIDVLQSRYIENVSCWSSFTSLVSLPVLDGECGPACHPQLLQQYIAELEGLGLCSCH